MTQGFNFPIPRPRGTPDQQAAAMAQNLRELEVWLNKFVRTGTAIDHGGLAGIADDDHTNLLNETRHDALAADNPHSVTFAQAVAADAGTDISVTEAETLTDGSDADALHTHAVIAGGTALLVDGSVDSTAIQRFRGSPTPIVLGATGGTQFEFTKETDAWSLKVSNNAGTFVQRMIFFSADHATSANDFQFKTGASGLAFLWDNSLDVWRMFKPLWVRDVLPETDVTYKLGSALATWSDVFADSLKDRAGAETYSIQTATFPTAHTFSAMARFTGTPTPIILGAAGGTQFSIVEDVDFFTINVGNAADVFLQRFVFFTSDHATAANDIQLRDGAGANALLWDNSLNEWRMFKALNVRTILPEADVTYAFGSATKTWTNGFFDALVSRAGVETYSIQTATFPVAHTFSAQVRFTNSTVPFILGAAGDTQMEFLETANGWLLAIGNNANSFTTRMTFQSSDHADAHDIDVFTGAGGLALRWDNSLDTFRFFKNITTSGTLVVTGSVEIDGAFNHDGTTFGVFGTAPATQQTGVAVTAAAIHAALVTYGIITA